MANTINGVTAITTEAQREFVSIELNGVLHNNQVSGLLYRGRVSYDSINTDFVLDDPTVATQFTTGSSIIPVGLEYTNTSAAVANLRFKEKLGAASAVNLNPYKLPSNSGIVKTIGPDPFNVPRQQYQLLITCDQIIELVIYYLIADKLTIGWPTP